MAKKVTKARRKTTSTKGADTRRPQGQHHQFGRARPSKLAGGFSLHQAPKRDTQFRPLPKPTGHAPYQLDLRSIIGADDYATISSKKKLTFHVNGDMGGIMDGMPQTLVAKGMEQDFDSKAKAHENPAFLYILGDCVYFNGEVKEYYSQFYAPYEFYPSPIFAVPGNHDGENVPSDATLDGFIRNFCAKEPKIMPESQDSGRTAMTQPNVFWTLLTPMANIVGLYTNVPEGGEVKQPQLDWLAGQFKTLSTDVPLLVTMHHPIYSADDHHSGSTYIKQALDYAVQQSDRHPDLVLAGHVHNYQRLTKALDDGGQIPYLVAGAGGYHNLHHVLKVDGESLITPTVFKDKDGEDVTLEAYTDDHHGFLRLEITSKLVIGRYYTVPRPQEPFSKGNKLIDYFEYNWRTNQYVPNTL